MPRPFSTRPLVLVALGLATACSGPDRPNVILITLDTTRADYLTTYQAREGHATPHFDALATEGIRFDHALSASAVTPVSHATILTGKYPYRHGLRVLSAQGGFRLSEDEVTLATVLKKEGYTTGAVHSAFPVSRHFGLHHGFDVFESMDGTMRKGEKGASWDTTKLQRRSDETTDRAIRFVDGADKPFFLWIHYWDPHDPILLPPEEYLEDVERGPNGQLLGGESLYAAELRFLDSEFGRLIAHLRRIGAYDDTIIVVTADHGEGLSDGMARHDWWAHRMVYQEQIHVPLIVRAPDAPSGRAVPDLVRTADVVPTVLDYAGVAPIGSLDGASLRPLIDGLPSEPRVAYAEQINGYDENAKMVERRPDAAFLYMVTDGEWKLTYRPHIPSQSELFNLREDPLEEHNLFDPASEHVLRLLGDLAQRNPWVTAPFEPDGLPVEDVSEELGNLGYAAGEIEDVAWQWVCARHPAERHAKRARCESCNGILMPVAAE